MKTYHYAAYGSNLHPKRLRKRVQSATLIGTELLCGFHLKFHKRSNKDGSGKCNILEGGSGVHVAVYEIAEFERMKLDMCEELGYGYEHQLIRLDEFGECSTYIADSSAIDESLSPIDWYKEYVLQGVLYHGFPIEYFSYIERQTSIADSDRNRGAQEWKLIQELRGGT